MGVKIKFNNTWRGDFMKFAAVLSIFSCVIGVLLFALIVFLIIMLMNRNKLKKIDFSNCPKLIFERYRLWHLSFSLWTFLEYFLLLIPLFTSVATIYFTTDVLSGTPKDSSSFLLTVMSFLSAFLPLINSKILPKTHADGFYKGAIILENGMLRHNEGIITTEELIEIAEKAEKYTNPLVNFENI